MRLLALGLALLLTAGMIGCKGSASIVTPTSTVAFDPEKDKFSQGFGASGPTGGEKKSSSKPGFMKN